jgi:hypothetical protein
MKLLKIIYEFQILPDFVMSHMEFNIVYIINPICTDWVESRLIKQKWIFWKFWIYFKLWFNKYHVWIKIEHEAQPDYILPLINKSRNKLYNYKTM